MNTNLIHNFLNIAMAAVAAFSVPEVIGMLSPEFGVAVVGVLATLKTVINVIRDGLAGLAKNQPPVK